MHQESTQPRKTTSRLPYKHAAQASDRHWRSGRTQNNGNSDLQCSVGTLYYRQGDYRNAAVYFERALAIDADNFLNLGRMAMAQHQLGKTSLAAEFLQRARAKEAYSMKTFYWSFLEIPLLLKEAEALIERPNGASVEGAEASSESTQSTSLPD